MPKDRKSLERSRQAKVMRQKSREKARRQQEQTRGTVDEYQFFRRDLLPPDVAPATWTRAQITNDLNGLNPGQALGEFVHLMVDPETMRSNPDGQAGYMTMAMNLWRVALAPAELQAGVIEEIANAVAREPEEQESFRNFARGMLVQHQNMFPRLHARVAQRRNEQIEAATAEYGAAGPALASTNDELFEEYARPLLDAAGEDDAAAERAYRLATLFSLAAREPLGNRAAALAMLRDRLPLEDRPYFDETAPMMMRRYRELFMNGAPAAAAAPTNGDGHNAVADAETAEPETERALTPEPEADTSPEAEPAEDLDAAPAKRSRLGGIFRRGG